MGDRNITHGNKIRFIVDTQGVDNSYHPEDSIAFDVVNKKIHIGGQEFISQQSLNDQSVSDSRSDKRWLVLANHLDVDCMFDADNELDPTRFDVVTMDWYEELKSCILEGGEYYGYQNEFRQHIVDTYLKDKNPKDYSRVVVLFGSTYTEIEPISGDTNTASYVVQLFESVMRMWNTPGNNSSDDDFDDNRTAAYMPKVKMFFRSSMPDEQKRIILKLMQNDVVWLGMHRGARSYATYNGFGDVYRYDWSFDDNLFDYLWDNDCKLHSWFTAHSFGSSTEPILKGNLGSWSYEPFSTYTTGSYYVRIDIYDNTPTMEVTCETYTKIPSSLDSTYGSYQALQNCYLMPYSNFDGYLANPYLTFKFNQKVDIISESGGVYSGSLGPCSPTNQLYHAGMQQLPIFDIHVDTSVYPVSTTANVPVRIRVDAKSIYSFMDE